MKNDLISRSEALEAVNQHSYETSYDWEETMDILEELPAVDAVPVVHARWIHCKGKSNLWHCSACGGMMLYNPTRRTYNIEKKPMSELNRFCRNCGARMDGEAE